MTITVQIELDDRITKYINRLMEQRHATETAAVRQLAQAGYEQVVRGLHARYQAGEITFRTMAAELGLAVRELYELLEQKGLRG